MNNFLGTNNVVGVIISAAKHRHTVIIVYTDSKGETTTRETEPYEIKNDKYWGYCKDKGSIRQFKIDNIRNAMETKQIYTPRWDVNI